MPDALSLISTDTIIKSPALNAPSSHSASPRRAESCPSRAPIRSLTRGHSLRSPGLVSLHELGDDEIENGWLHGHGVLRNREPDDILHSLGVCQRCLVAFIRGERCVDQRIEPLTLLFRAQPVLRHAPARGRPPLPSIGTAFNLHAGVRIEAGDDLGSERLCR
jgi:hypothetical protein